MSRAVLTAALATPALGLAIVIPLPAATAAGATDLSASVRAAMLAEHGQETLSTPVREPLVEPTRTAGSWVFGSTTIPLRATDEHKSPKMALFLAHRSRDGWRVELHSTPGFTDLAAKAPRSVLSDGEKRTFASHQAAASWASTLATDTGLGLPWAQGVSWWMGGGPHGSGGRPFNALDFNGGNGQVLSAGPGRVYKSCIRNGSAFVNVIHDNGWTTSYYHMVNLTTLADGSRVSTGTYLGKIGNELPCGGFSSGAHVHFSLLRGNTAHSVNGMKFGGWTFYEGSSAYAGYAERNGAGVNRGGQVTNYGPGSSPAGGRIVGAASGKCVDVNGSNTANGSQVALWSCNGGANQRWSHS